MYGKTKDEKYLKKATYFYNWLKENYSKGYSGICWGYNFPWASKEKYLKPFIPSAVVTGFVANGLFEYYKINPNEEIKGLLESSCLFLDKDLEKVYFDEGVSISYTPVKKDVCYNASLLAAEIFAKTSTLNNNQEYCKLAIRAVDYVISKQKEDGHWKYSFDTETKTEKHQVDFHQGYILESIFEIKKILQIDNKEWDNAIKKGLDFYIEKQFDNDGRSLWRIPKKYPVEIHNQSQGIITFHKLRNYNPKASDFVLSILNWTIANMQSAKGYFYYQKFKTHTHKIPYMRWSQAWMFLAFANCLNRNDIMQ